VTLTATKVCTNIFVDGEKEMGNIEGFVINQLVKRFEKPSIIYEKDCIKFKQKRCK
jgi:hypothetical protein